jgi:restriction system protein
VDLLLYSGGRKTVVQCKRWRTSQVGVSPVRELYGVMVAEVAARAIFVTAGSYTPDAIAFARGKPIELVDGSALSTLVDGVQPSRPPRTVIEASVPACPRCGGGMVQRVAKRGTNAGKFFWGCGRYPECRGVRDAP